MLLLILITLVIGIKTADNVLLHRLVSELRDKFLT